MNSTLDRDLRDLFTIFSSSSFKPNHQMSSRSTNILDGVLTFILHRGSWGRSIGVSLYLSILAFEYLGGWVFKQLSIWVSNEYLSNWMSICVSKYLNEYLIIRISIKVSVSVFEYLDEYLSIWMSIWESEWVSEYLNKYLSIWISIWESEWVSENLNEYLSILISIWVSE